MPQKTIFMSLGAVAIVWLGYMAWLSGYRQGYNEGSETAWDEARTALMQPLPVLNLETVSATNP